MPIQWNADALLGRVRQAAMLGVVEGAEMVRTEAVSLILEGPKTGRVYRRRGTFHQASAPGEAPASDTGGLVGRITTDFNYERLVGVITARTDYAPALEFGTPKMEARPFMRPALANKRLEIMNVMHARILGAFQ